MNGMTAECNVRNISVRHTRSADKALAEAMRLSLGFSEAINAELAALQSLNARRMSSAEMRSFARRFLNADRDKWKDAQERAKVEADVDDLCRGFCNFRDTHGETAGDAYNAATHFLDYQHGRMKQWERRFESAHFGPNAKAKTRALTMIG